MASVIERDLREQLLDRRQRLQTAIAEFEDATHLVHLLQEVDAALERMNQGTYGLCEVCHESIEIEALMANPLVRVCLGDLTPDQQRALEDDLELASRIQGELLPQHHLSFDGWEISYYYEPAGPVSGDYCDVLKPEAADGDLLFLLGDISGKGVAASMLMAHLHAIFRSLITADLPVHRLVERANRIFGESTLSSYYATLVCGRASRSGAVEICNAGHPAPLWMRGRQVLSIEATGLPVGLFASGRYTARRLQLAPGDSLFLYTDGLTEARNQADVEYGVERLSSLLRDCDSFSPQGLISACLEDLTAFRSGAPKTDDLTLMAIRRS